MTVSWHTTWSEIWRHSLSAALFICSASKMRNGPMALCIDRHLTALMHNKDPLTYITLALMLTHRVITPWWMKLCRLSDASPLWARSSWHRSVCSIENESRQAYLHGVKKPSWFIISSKELFTEELCWSWCEDSCYLCAECTTSCKGFSPHRFTRWKSTHKQRNVYVGCTTMGEKVFPVQNAGFIY